MTNNEINAAWQEIVNEQVSSLRFGVVQIVVHESRVVQIEKTEKVRFPETQALNKNSSHRSAGGFQQLK